MSLLMGQTEANSLPTTQTINFGIVGPGSLVSQFLGPPANLRALLETQHNTIQQQAQQIRDLQNELQTQTNQAIEQLVADRDEARREIQRLTEALRAPDLNSSRQIANTHFLQPEVQVVYRYLFGTYTCLYDPKKRSFPQQVTTLPHVGTLVKYELMMSGQHITADMAKERSAAILVEQTVRVAKGFVEVVPLGKRKKKLKGVDGKWVWVEGNDK